jgi:hypothetical protein
MDTAIGAARKQKIQEDERRRKQKKREMEKAESKHS